MTEYTMAIGKENFYIGPTDLKIDKRLEISKKDFRYPQFVTIESFDKEIKEQVADFFEDSGEIKVFKSVEAIKAIHDIFIENKREFDHFDCE